MSRPFTILSEADAAAFDLAPAFSFEDRKRYFYRSEGLEKLLETQVRGSLNKAYFLLAFGYFKAARRFFAESHDKDRAYVARLFGISPDKITDVNYQVDTRKKHKQLILNFFGCKAFDRQAKKDTIERIRTALRSQVKPSILFDDLIKELVENGYEIPEYKVVARLITSTYNEHKNGLISKVNQLLTPTQRDVLQSLFVKENDDKGDDYARYRLTLLKRFSQSVRPSRIQSNVDDLLALKELQPIAGNILEALDLNYDGIRQFAQTVLKSEIFQIHRRAENDRFLHLIAFINHQYYSLQDALTATLQVSERSNRNWVEKEIKEAYYKKKQSRTENVQSLLQFAHQWMADKRSIQTIFTDNSTSAEEKLSQIQSIVLSANDDAFRSQIDTVEQDNSSTQNDHYHYMELLSQKLQNRVSDIVKHLTFDPNTLNKGLFFAIADYQTYDGKVGPESPADFLTDHERKQLHRSDGSFRPALYKALLFHHVSEAIDSGVLHLLNSYKYRSLDAYQIPKALWDEKKDELLVQANMHSFKDFHEVVRKLHADLDEQMQNTNQHLMRSENDFVKPNGMGGYRISAARHVLDVDENRPLVDLYPKTNFVSLTEVLATVHSVTSCLDSFEHWQHKYSKERPSNAVFCAGVIGLGCHFGVKRIAKISKEINPATLENAINWYFSLENIRRASDSILHFIQKMKLPELYKANQDKTHTSSDGQKYVVANDSLNANFSFKYGGNAKVSSEYGFIDDQHRFYYSEVISGAEREAHYMIDGIMRNDIVKSDIHSTDTHGYSEMIFGITYLLPIAFAPRIKNVHKQHLYTLKNRKYYENMQFPILPNDKVKLKIIEPYWDDILRFVASIKLKETTASQLFRRINSHSKGINPLYDALKEFGRLPKSLFILKYIDDPDLREAITRQLNKGESGNKLSRALAIGNPDYLQITKEEQDIAESCKRLIKNAIVCWNYMYLTRLLQNERDPAKKAQLLEDIKKTSVVSWEHINLHGEYDFSDTKLKDSIGFKLSEILDPKLLDF